MAGGTALGAVSSIPDSSGVIHGCYEPGKAVQTDGARLSIIDSTKTSCSKHETPISWNQTGPVGPAGPSTAGTAGLDVVSIEEYGTAPALNRATVSCPADHPFVLGGGGLAMDSSDQLVPVVFSGPVLVGLAPNAADEGLEHRLGWTWGWVVGGPAGSEAVAYAICAK
jgi:hypothetical protein